MTTDSATQGTRRAFSPTAWSARAEVFRRACREGREGFLRACEAPGDTQRAVLRSCIDHSLRSAFARQHGLDRVATVEQFRRAVPIRDYEALEPWIARAVAGHSSELTDEDPVLWLKTSGTTGPAKRIPQTRHWRLRYRGPAIYAQWGTYLHYHPYLVDHPGSTIDMSWEPDSPTTFLGGVGYQAITHREFPLGEGDWAPPWIDEPWFRFGPAAGDYVGRMQTRLRLCAGESVRAIVTVNPSALIALANQLKVHTEDFLRHAHSGPGRSGDAARALARRAAARGWLVPGDLWPNLSLLVCWKSAGAALYMNELESLFPKVTVMPFATTGTEGVVTLPVDEHPTAGLLAVTQGFYEFVPHADGDVERLKGDEDALLPKDLEVGSEYRLVMTQGNGLWRYDVGDRYRVLERVKSVPRLEYVGRVGSVSSFTGEKLTERQIIEAMNQSLDALGHRRTMFSCCPVWGSPPHYEFVLESAAAWPAAQVSALEEEIERQLGIANAEYEGKRESLRLGRIIVRIVPADTFGRLWSALVAAGSAPAQLKHRWLHRNADLLSQVQLMLRDNPGPDDDAGGAGRPRGRSAW